MTNAITQSRRQALVSKLAKSLGDQSTTKAINEVDEWQQPGNLKHKSSSFIRGPFSVFAIDQQSSSKDDRWSRSGTEGSPSGSVPTDVDGSGQGHAAGTKPFSSVTDCELSHETAVQDVLNEPIDSTSATGPFLALSPSQEPLDFYDTDFASLFPPTSPQAFMKGTPSELWDYWLPTLSIPPSPSALSSVQISKSDGLLSQMEPLLRHYKERVLEPAADLRKWRKSPWQLLFWPCALETYGEIKLWNTASHPRSAVLYAILANSAYHLHATERCDDKWREFGLKYQNKAKRLLFQALQDEILGVARAKYKELLMAILSVAMVSLFDKPEAFKGYLLAAEYVIRHRGLHKQNSVKARTLQHMYTHLRILTEGTCTFADCISEFTGLNHHAVAPAVLPKFEMLGNPQGNDLRLDGTTNNDNDIHLATPKPSEDALYSTIYGIPESLMCLLSRIVACANEKDKLRKVASFDAPPSDLLQKHLQTLEHDMWSWKIPTKPSRPEAHKFPALSSEGGVDSIDSKLSGAMHQAVIIYFYRRVYDTDAMVLQEQVRRCLDELQPCIDHTARDQDFATSVAWAAYVAACGAVTTELRDRALAHLEAIDSQGVILTPKPTVQISKFWQRRLERGLVAAGERSVPVSTAA
ncbi:putative C6 transcription factor [Metarhizium anisopliae]|nr:putative C6 transcription factor [Metarhizium anisopliae]